MDRSAGGIVGIAPLPAGSRLQRTGSLVLGGGSTASGSRPPSSGGLQRSSSRPSSSLPPLAQFEQPATPPSVSHAGRLWQYDSAPGLDPFTGTAQSIPCIKKVKAQRIIGREEPIPNNIWSDSVQHLGAEQWPAHAVPLFSFCSGDRPRPKYRQEFRFTIKEERYVNLCIKMRGGGGDRYTGGTVGLIHCPNRTEAVPGQEGQLATILDLVVNPDNTVVVHAIGDLPFFVKRVWLPRGLRGVQCAFVDIDQATRVEDTVLETCEEERGLQYFARALRLAAPELAEDLARFGEYYTAFVPNDGALIEAWGELRDEDLVENESIAALLRCHVVKGKVPCEALYNGRVIKAIDDSPHIVTFRMWPRGDARINEVPITAKNVMCSNGVIHIVDGVLAPSPAPTRRGR